MARNDIPPRPLDLAGSIRWDLTYGPLSQSTPFGKLGQQIDGLKEDMKSVINVSKSIDEMNRTMKETNAILKDSNNALKVLADRLK